MNAGYEACTRFDCGTKSSLRALIALRGCSVSWAGLPERAAQRCFMAEGALCAVSLYEYSTYFL